MNTIASSTLKEYAECIKQKITILNKITDDKIYERIGIATCLLVPASQTIPDFFIKDMRQKVDLLTQLKADSVKSILVESITEHLQRFPHLK